MLKIILSTLISFVLLANLQIAFASTFEKKFLQSSEKSLLQEAESDKNAEGKCECEDSDFVNYEKDGIANFNPFQNFVRIENEKIFSDFSRSPSSPPPDFFIS